MENLYNSVKFSKACYKHPKKFLVHGVINKRGRQDVPGYLKQEEVKNNKTQAQVRGTLEAAVL